MTPEEGREVALVALRVAEQQYGFTAREEREDLIQEAWIAVLRAAVTYRPTREDDQEGRFRSWCLSKGVWAVLDWYRSQRPLGTRSLTRSRRAESASWPHTHSLDEMLETSGWGAQRLADESLDLWNRAPADLRRVESEESVRASIRDAPLTPEERVVLFARYWNGYEQRTIGVLGLGLSESRVSQIETAALAKIRPFLEPQYDDAIAELMRERAA